MFTYLEEDGVEDVEVVATDLASAAALLRAVALHLHLAVCVAHHRQNHRERHQGVECAARHHLTAQDRPLAARDADRLLEASLQPREGAETGRGLLVTTLRDYPGILHVPNPHVSNRAHQRPGCDHEPHRAVAVALQVVHDL
ncbi:hypothetical protein Ptr902_09465 [Pyrenophora tritici-repentis]|nr:hypothetical protein PtrSN001A_008362 [Pyrenophora tritici-repentis]KAI1531690.1 hypothetical protein PtrSN001C_008228 [Pyrenophora tritici-repentis]KAI1598191.1 hypothetical protein PtrCC142_008350 [Pyrenophora tritici-repentis]KAI2479254.1 hypothetical protein Ptr902_09465 [Pyrenophora tritici-repentis]